MHILLPSSVLVRRYHVGFRLALAAFLICLFVLPTSRAYSADTETKTWVAFSMKAAQSKTEAAIKAGEDIRKTQLDLYQLGGITRPWAVVLDPASGDWILVGERDVNSSILTLDDWAVALRARFLHAGDKDPGVSIDPLPLDPSAKVITPGQYAATQKVRFVGGIENTHFGRVCFDADWLMKRVGFGIDKLNVDGLETYYDLLSQGQQGVEAANSKVACRFWFLPVVNRVNVLGDVVLLERFKMGVFTEVMYAEVGGKPVADLEQFQNSASEEFSRSLTDHYDAAAKANDVLETLRGLTRLAGLGQGLTQSEYKPDVSFWLYRYPVAKVETPEHADVLKSPNRRQGWELSGGVQLAALVAKFKGGDAQALKQVVLKTRPNESAFAWRFDVEFKNGQPTFVVLPSNLSDPDRIAALADHAWFLYQKKRYDDALEALDAAFDKAPEFAAEAYWMRAIILREYGLETGAKVGGSQALAEYRLEQAISLFKKSIAANPKFAPAQFELGVTLGAFGDNKGAIEALERAVAIDKDYTPAYFKLGAEYVQAGNTSRATECLNLYLAKEPTGSIANDAKEMLGRLNGKSSPDSKDYKDDKLGVSFRYPADWAVLTRNEMAQKSKGMIGDGNPNLVLAVGNPDDWDQNVNIQIVKQQGVLSEEQLNNLAGQLDIAAPQQFTDFKKVSQTIVTIQGSPALEYVMLSTRMGVWMECKEDIISTRNRAFIVTCTAKKDAFEQLDKTRFQVVVQSFKDEQMK